MSDLATLKIVVQSMAQKYPAYLQFDICQKFRSFFFINSLLSGVVWNLHECCGIENQ